MNDDHQRRSNRAMRVAAALAILLAAFANIVATPGDAEARALGRGNYAITASVFGTEQDGLIGQVTSSGRTLRGFDRLVALPACTQSSCPWLNVNADPTGRWGPQTACAGSGGICWVEVSLPETGACAVAPVYDLGPLFKRDNWWDLRRNRTYFLKRGLPAAEAARDGADLGFGPGISDAGYDIAGVYRYAAAIDLGAGTWIDLGLDPGIGVTNVRVKLLWQAGVRHTSACDGKYGNGSASEDVNLRTGPSRGHGIQTVVLPGRRLSIVSPIDDGFYQVDVDGRRGWIAADYLDPDDGKIGDTIAIATGSVNFRAGPSTADAIKRVVPAGTAVVVTGGASGDFLPVRLRGEQGWIARAFLDLGDAGVPSGDIDGGSGETSIAVTTDDVNFRTGPSLRASIMRVLPAGTQVTLTGEIRNDFAAVRAGGADGWVSTDFLMVADDPGETFRVTEALNLRAGPSTADRILLVMPAGATVAWTGARQNDFLSVSYNGREGWAHSRYLE